MSFFKPQFIQPWIDAYKKGGIKEPSLYQRILGIPMAYPIVSLIILLVSVVAVVPQLFIAAASAEFLNSFLGDSKAYMGMPII